MANRDVIPLPPKNAEVKTMSCQYCIVGCGYKSYVWPTASPSGTPDAAGNALGADYPTGPGFVTEADAASVIALSKQGIR